MTRRAIGSSSFRLYHRLPSLTDDEQALWVLDQAINQRGFYTDGALLDASSRIAAEAGQATQDELSRITDGELTSTDQVAAMLAWLGERGCKIQDLKKPTLGHALRFSFAGNALAAAIAIVQRCRSIGTSGHP
jgi:DNA polymerase